jgi:transglutaminase-like putative cysteine protease
MSISYRSRVGDLGDTPWWANAPAGIAAMSAALCAVAVRHLETKAVAWLAVVVSTSFAVSLSRRVLANETRPSLDRRLNATARQAGMHGGLHWLVLHAVMVGAGVAPFLFWARGGGAGVSSLTLISTTAAAIGLLFGTRSGLTISVASSAGTLALSLASDTRLGGWWLGGGVPFWLAGIATVALLSSCAFIARLGLAELATGPNVPAPFSAPPSDKRGVGLFHTPPRRGITASVIITSVCVLIALMIEPFVSPITQKASQSAADRLTGGSDASRNADNPTIFKGANGKDQSSSQVLGANDSFTIDNFGATSDAEVLRVTFNVGKERFKSGAAVPRGALLKGQSFDSWDGHGWHNTAEVVKTLRPMESTFSPAKDPAQTGDVFLSRVKVIRGSTNLIFGPTRVVQVDLSDQPLLLRSDDSIVTSSPMGPGTEYLVVTARTSARDNAPDVDRSLLANNPQELIVNGVFPQHFDTTSLSPAAQILARSFGTNESSIQGVARNIEKWLAANTSYDFSVRHSPTDSTDVVDQFLFKTKAGWCEQIATSTVMLLRANGIPARLATGYLPSSVDANGTFRVLGRDAHAWVEYYLPGYGWAQLDPTQVVPVANLPPTRTETPSRSYSAALWVVTGILFCLFLVGFLISRRRQKTVLSPVETRVAALQRFGAQRELVRKSNETLTEYGTSLERKFSGEGAPVRSMVALLEQERFSETQNPANLTEVDRILVELETEFPVPKKRK